MAATMLHTTGGGRPQAPPVPFQEPIMHYCANVAAEPYAIRRALLDLRALFGPACGTDLVARVELVMAEIMNNIAEHGDLLCRRPSGGNAPRQIHLSVAPALDGLFCIVSDKGAAVPADCLTPRRLPADDNAPGSLPEGGFGWFMIQTMARRLYYGREGDRNVLAFLIPADSPLAAA